MPSNSLCLLLLLCITGTYAGDKSNLRRLSLRLTRAKGPLFCRASLASDTVDVEVRIRNAISCRNSGLPTAEFNRLSAICNTRLDRKNRLEACAACSTKRKNNLRKKFDQSTDACRKITGQRNCFSLTELQAKLRRLQAIVCPPLDTSVATLQQQYNLLESRLIAKAGLSPAPFPLTILEPELPATSTVVFVHGVTSNVFELISYAMTFQRALPTTRVVLPQAPLAFIDFFNVTAPSWFNILSNTLDAKEAVDEIIFSANGMAQIGEIQRKVYGMDKVGIVGISQGAAVTLTTYLRHRWDGVVSIAGFLPLLSSYPAALSPDSADVKALLMHGTADMLVPFQFSLLSNQALNTFGRRTKHVPFPGEDHGLNNVLDTVNRKTIRWLKASLNE